MPKGIRSFFSLMNYQRHSGCAIWTNWSTQAFRLPLVAGMVVRPGAPWAAGAGAVRLRRVFRLQALPRR